MQFWALETARAAQAYLLSQGNPYALHRAHAFMARARRCLSETKDPRIANMVINRVLNKQLDTVKRQQVYKEAVDQWIHKVNRTEMPTRPDDRWSAACDGPEPEAGADYTVRLPSAGTAITRLSLPAAEEKEMLPPPNFFITRAMPLTDESDEQPPLAASASVAVTPLPVTPLETQPVATADNDPGSEIPTPTIGGWQMYPPRPRDESASRVIKPSRATTRIKVASKANPKLRVKKLQPGYVESTEQPNVAVAIAKTAPAAPVQAAPSPIQPEPTTQEDPTNRVDALPAALRELAPYIRNIERR